MDKKKTVLGPRYWHFGFYPSIIGYDNEFDSAKENIYSINSRHCEQSPRLPPLSFVS